MSISAESFNSRWFLPEKKSFILAAGTQRVLVLFAE